MGRESARPASLGDSTCFREFINMLGAIHDGFRGGLGLGIAR